MALDLTNLLPLLGDHPAYRQVLTSLQEDGPLSVSVVESAKPFLIAALLRKLRMPLLLLTGKPEKAKNLFEQMQTWCPGENVKMFPEPEGLPYERLTTDNATELERLQVLCDLVQYQRR